MKILLINATIYPVTSPVIFNGFVLIENGIIQSFGPQRPISTTEHTHIIDCKGKYLLPGFIDVHTHLGLYDEGTGWAGNDANETHEVMTPHVRAHDGVYPLDISFREAIASGITTAHIMPGSRNVIGGTTCTVKTYGKNISKMIIDEPAGLKIAFGENPKQIHSHSNKESITRMGIMGMVRELFYKALHSNEDNHRLLSVRQALKREIPVRIHAHRADDIISGIRLGDEFNLDIRIEHCTEGHLIAEELAGRNLMVCVGPTLTRRSKVELKNKTWKTYIALNEYDINVSITTDHPYTPIQYLNVCAAIAVREGLSPQKALEGITINPAHNLRLAHRIGSIDIGKDADLVLWSHHPFEYLAKPIFTMIDGQIVYQHT